MFVRERIMKRLLLSLSAVVLVFAASLLISEEAMAQNIASTIYDFSSYPIADGLSPQYYVNNAMIGNLLQKNPDGTLAVDSSGLFYADSSAVDAFVSTLAALYNVPGKLEMDQNAERKYITSLIASGNNEASHKPAMNTKIGDTMVDAVAAAQFAGQTYVDVSISQQKLVYYVNGAPVLVSDLVTGNTSRHHDTPKGVFQIYNKQTGRTLKGDGYSAYVNYWMPFTGNYGLHDATWRKSFGGEIYKTNGSHGCVNMPKSMAETLYSMVSVGTVVYIHD